MQLICIHLYFIVFIIHSLIYMVCFSFVNMDVQSVSNPYKYIFNIVIANRRHVAYFMCVVVRYTATLVLDTLVLQVTHF